VLQSRKIKFKTPKADHNAMMPKIQIKAQSTSTAKLCGMISLKGSPLPFPFGLPSWLCDARVKIFLKCAI
jgi:hypothetical protein